MIIHASHREHSFIFRILQKLNVLVFRKPCRFEFKLKTNTNRKIGNISKLKKKN